jgi:hypothetical protein
MPEFVMKVDRDRDLYVLWSTVVEAPIFAGDREAMLARLAEDAPYEPVAEFRPKGRLARADECGTSAMYGSPPYDGAFDDTGLIVEQRGWLPRADLGRFVDALLADDPDAAYAALQPFEDEQAEGFWLDWLAAGEGGER